jgi:hypothetical protein
MIKFTLYKALIRSVMTYACPTWEYVVASHLLKLQCLQNRVLPLEIAVPAEQNTPHYWKS